MLDSDDSTSYMSLNQIRKDSISYGSSNEAANGSPIKKQQLQTQRFTSNMCAILNDPRKDRNKINYLFTKTWGSDFTDTSSIPSIKTLHSNYSNLKKIEFNDYIKYIAEKHSRHIKNKNVPTINSKLTNGTLPDLEQIPKIYFDPNFSLNNKETFNAIISQKLFEKLPRSKSNKIIDRNNPFLNDTHKLLDDETAVMTTTTTKTSTESFQDILEKLNFYLDITETHISKQISTKANTFFHAMTSQDEVQEHILRTCTAVKCLRKNIINLDERLVLSSIRAIKFVHLRIKYRNLVEKFELMSFVYKTQPTIQLHLSSSEFTGALDLIAMSQEILRQDLRGIRSLRHYDSQFGEIEKAIDKILHQEFIKYIISDLSRSFNETSDVLNEEKLCSLMLGIIRCKMSNFILLCKDEIFVYIKSTVKQTIVEYISQLDDDSNPNLDDENNLRLIDQVKQLKIQEFLHLLSRVLTNVRTMLGRVKSIVTVLIGVLNSVADIKKIESLINEYGNNSNKELLTKENHLKLTQNLKDLLTNSCDYAQERLVSLLEGKFKENGIDKLNSNDFISLSNLIDQFIIDFDSVVDKKTSALRSWIQNQANKFLHKFHQEKKEKLTIALENERWKQSEIPVDFKNLVDHIITNGIGAQNKKFDSKVKNSSDFILINNEKYVIFGTVIVLIKIMVEYCQFSLDIPNLTFDVMTRIVEIFKIFNSKTYQMILGVGAVQTGLLRIITFKTLAITYRCLEMVLFFLPLLKEFFDEKLPDKKNNLSKQFNQLIKDYNDHKIELKNKLVSMIDENFREFLFQYEVIAPVPSQCFRSICQQITRVHEIFTETLSNQTVVSLFTEIHLKFKQRLSQRLKDLNVNNDGGPQHALIFSDMSYYIKQFKSLEGLHLISLNFEDVFS